VSTTSLGFICQRKRQFVTSFQDTQTIGTTSTAATSYQISWSLPGIAILKITVCFFWGMGVGGDFYLFVVTVKVTLQKSFRCCGNYISRYFVFIFIIIVMECLMFPTQAF
jgi:hypothetical protein